MDVVMKTNAQGQTRMQEADFNESRRVVRVLPKNDQIRKYVKHPTGRVGWLAEGSAEWPNDAFTKRRLRDGDITIEQAAAPEGQQQRAIEQKTAKPAKAES